MISRSTTSITYRLLLASLAVTVLFTVLIGFVLERGFRVSLRTGVSEQLQLQIFNLLAQADVSEQQFLLPKYMFDERLNDPQSGLIAWVVSGNQPSAENLLWKSQSTRWHSDLEQLGTLKPLLSGQAETGEWTIASDPFFYRRYQVVWDINNQELPFQLFVMQTQSPFLAQITSFRQQLWGWLIALAVGLLLTWMAVLKWGLVPLRRLAQELLAIESGDQEQLQGRYPTEIEPVTRNLNRVLKAEQDQRQRYRQTLADLAHSLKTPLAVIRSAQETMDQTDVADQVERMDQIIGYQLSRAVVSKKSGFVGAPVEIKPVGERLISALQRVYSDTEFELSADPAQSAIKMDEKDLMEVLGNLIENAAKYGQQKVLVRINGQKLSIQDDGPGIPTDQRQSILQRGIRLDTLNRGQGIGLAIVTDILNSYSLELEIESSPLGGASFTIAF